MNAKECVAGIVYSQKSSLTFQYMNVQWQSNLNDCGLHAIASITALCHNTDPTEVTFDPKKLRPHLIECLTSQRMTMFAILKNHKKSDRCCKNAEEVDIYCTCRKPYTGAKMASCDTCGEWFHQECEVIPEAVFSEKKSAWYCHKCCKNN